MAVSARYSPADLAKLRAALGQAPVKTNWSLDLVCKGHPDQLTLVKDQSQSVVVIAGRRGGKSFAAVAKGIDLCLANAGSNVLYISATYNSAKRMAWRPLLDLNTRFKLGGTTAGLVMTFPNGSTFTLMGCETEKGAQKALGIPKLILVIVDELQLYKTEVAEYLLSEVLLPGKYDNLGKAAIWCMGTPNRKGKVGSLWKRWANKKWSHHHWTIYQNPHLGTPEAIELQIQKDLAEESANSGRPVTKESAWFKREFMGLWEVDKADRVYYFDDEANVYTRLPTNLTEFLITGDIGVTANDAVLVFGWSENDPTIYHVEEHVAPGKTDMELGDLLARLDSLYHPIKIVLDAGGGGKKTLISIQALHPDLPLEAAVKPPVNIQVRALNSRLQHGRMKCKADSVFYADIRQFTWVDGIVNGQIDENSGHSDVVPSARYGCIAAGPYLPPPLDDIPPEVVRLAKEKADKQERLRKAMAKFGYKKPKPAEESWTEDPFNTEDVQLFEDAESWD